MCVLTSDIPENNEVVTDVGFTFRRGNQLDLQHKMDYLLRNPEIRRAAGKRGQKRIQTGYLWPTVARSIEKVYYCALGLPGKEISPGRTAQRIRDRGRRVNTARPLKHFVRSKTF